MGKAQKLVKLLVDTSEMTAETIQYFQGLKMQGHTIWYLHQLINADSDLAHQIIKEHEAYISLRAYGLPELNNKIATGLIMKAVRDKVYGLNTKEKKNESI